MQEQLLAQLIDYYEQFDQQSSDKLDDLYAENVVFIDPVHRVEGVVPLKAYFESMGAGLSSCRFEFTEKTIGLNEAWLQWEMHYCHPRIGGGRPLQLTGVSHLKGEGDKFTYHRDFYDLGAMLYEHVPVLGVGVRWLKRKLS